MKKNEDYIEIFFLMELLILIQEEILVLLLYPEYF